MLEDIRGSQKVVLVYITRVDISIGRVGNIFCYQTGTAFAEFLRS
jgi:hypothetical protein